MSKQQNKEDKARWRVLGMRLLTMAMMKPSRAEQYREAASALRTEADALDARATELESDS